MFYSSEILGIKSNSRLGVVWLAATLGPKSSTRKLGRRDLTTVDIPATCEYLVHPPQALSLRLAASMMIGVSRVYGQQCLFQYQDVQHFCARITRIQTTTDLDMQPHQKTASAAAITMGKVDSLPVVSVLADLALPELDISAMLNLGNGYGTPEQGRKDRLIPGSSASNSSSLAKPPFSSVSRNGSSHGFPSTDSSILHGDLMGSVAFPSDDLSDMDNAQIGLELFQRNRPAMPSLTGMDVPLDIEPVAGNAKRSRPRKHRMHNFFDTELMLGKDELFLSEADITFASGPASAFPPAKRDIYERVIEAMLRPDGDLIEGLGHIQLPVHLELPVHLKKPKPETAIPDNEVDFGDIEVMRGYGNDTDGRFAALSTPSTKAMPWSSILGSDLGRLSSASSNSIDSLYGGMAGLAHGSSPSSVRSALPFFELPERVAPGASNASSDTLGFFTYLRSNTKFASQSRCTLYQLLNDEHGRNRSVAAHAFGHLLELASAAMIRVSQAAPFRDIQISWN